MKKSMNRRAAMLGVMKGTVVAAAASAAAPALATRARSTNAPPGDNGAHGAHGDAGMCLDESSMHAPPPWANAASANPTGQRVSAGEAVRLDAAAYVEHIDLDGGVVHVTGGHVIIGTLTRRAAKTEVSHG